MKNTLLLIGFLFAFSAFSQDVPQEKIWRTTEVSSKPDLEKGMYTLRMFIADNFQFPDLKNKKVTVFTSFIIEPDGQMTERKAFYVSAKDLVESAAVAIQTEDQKIAEAKAYEAMKNEAARVLALFNETWIPARVAGKPVRCLYNYPISFNIE